MALNAQEESTKRLESFLRRHAPYSVIESGVQLSDEDAVLECGRSGEFIRGTVKSEQDDDPSEYSVSIQILSSHRARATCTCSSEEEMEEQWCPHAVALLWRAASLEFFDLNSGFASEESALRMNVTSPDKIAGVIGDIHQDARAEASSFFPELEIWLDLSDDRLGVQVLFDEQVQEPGVFEGFSKKSSRALDNLLIQLLDDHGTWDDDKRLWCINSSRAIENIIGLIQEYRRIFDIETRLPVKFSRDLLDAQLLISWTESGAELSFSWLLPDSDLADKEAEIFGTGPFWTTVEGTVYRLSRKAAKIASIFPYSPQLTLPRGQVGSILEALSANEISSHFVLIENSELQPETEVHRPVPTLKVEKMQAGSEHFTSQNELSLQANLEFVYPEAPADKNVVYLPNREEESKVLELLRRLGFSKAGDQLQFQVQGDAALDFIHDAHNEIPKFWKLHGLSKLRSMVRFSELSMEINFSSSDEKKAEKVEDWTKLDWFDCHLALRQDNSNLPISSLFRQMNSGSNRWIRLDSGAFARVPGGGLKRLKGLLGALEPNFRLSNNIKTKLTAAQALNLTWEKGDQLIVHTDRRLKQLSQKLQEFQKIKAAKEPKNFVGELRPYQAEGLGWLFFLHDFAFGGILADEMGLGKTVQALALIQQLKDSRAVGRKLKRPALVVAPTSVITNWYYEAKRFCPKLKVLLLHGPQRRKHFKDISENDLVITSYALLRIDRQELEKNTFSYCILDEAQNIKNPLAATTRAAKAVKSYRRLALTGTPTENRPLELWSIFDFLIPGYLGSLDYFRTQVEKPILEGGTDNKAAKALRAKTSPFVMRRLKAEVEKELPEKIESELLVSMTNSQLALYQSILEEVRPRVMQLVDQRGVRGASVSILAALLRLRQVCNHPNSIKSMREVEGYDSGKFQLLRDLVRDSIESNRKLLIFSQFRDMLGIIRQWLEESNYKHLYLDGLTRNRQDLIDQFNEDESVRAFLISLKAGGTGLNLTAADTVIIYDPWWNPAVENQAVDRAHRIGQEKHVSVYRLITENSIEQKIMSLKARKSQIFDTLVNDGGGSPLDLSRDELEELLTLDPGQQE